MLVAAAVPNDLAQRLRHAAGRRFAFEAARGWDAVLASILRQPVEMAVIDPALEGPPRAHEIERLKLLFPSLPVLLYTRLTPTMGPVLLRLGKAGVRQILLAGHDDHSRRIVEVLLAEASFAVSARLVAAITDLLSDCPGELRWAIETMVRQPAEVQSVKDLADRARMDRRTLLRWFAKAELPPPRAMLTALRVVYAHRLLQDPGYTIEDVATKLGYSQSKTFALNVKDVFGMTPGEIRVALTPDEAISIVREKYFPEALVTEPADTRNDMAEAS